MDKIIIRGARQHNLKNINLEIPKNKLVVFTGLSGSGKSSLAFDTIYAEGQRRYVESLSAYARQFLGIMSKPDVDTIEGLSPAISIDQKSTSHNPRSTVGTVTEIYDYLRLLFARVGHPHCSQCGREIERQSSDQIIESLFTWLDTESAAQHGGSARFLIMAPLVRDRKGEFSGLFDNLKAKGFSSIRIDGTVFDLHDDLVLIKTNKHTIEVIVDRIAASRKELRDEVARSQLRSRIAQAVEQSLALSDGLVVVCRVNDASLTFPDKPKSMEDRLFSQKFACPVCNIAIAEIEPRNFSFNSPHGACPACSGIGTILEVDPERIINPNLSINEGGVIPFAKMFFNDTWFGRVIKTVAIKEGINLSMPLEKLTESQKKVLLYGTGQQVHEVYGTNRFGKQTEIHEQFSGFINELKRRYAQTESDFIRAEIEKYMQREVCFSCNGSRLKKEVLSVTINGLSIAQVTAFSITEVAAWFAVLPKALSAREQEIGKLVLKEITKRLSFLTSVGLTYLTLDRSAQSLSGGEAQRIRLTSQIGSGLSGVLYVLDEPSIGLHARDNARLIASLHQLRDLDNTVIVVEHDKEMMEHSDYIVDFGPGAGKHGGAIIAQGTPLQICKDSQSLTGKYLSGKKQVTVQKTRQLQDGEKLLTLTGCSANNLQHIDVSFPLGQFICITGVSGSGKSSLIIETLYPALARILSPLYRQRPGPFGNLSGIEHIDKAIMIDQSPIGRTPRSNPVTYTGAFTYIRELFANLSESRKRGFGPGRFSFNVKGGRCEACQGEGQVKIEMQFLADVYITCEVCSGRRYNSETLEVEYKGKNIAQVLSFTIEDALQFFSSIPHLREKLQTLRDVGLSYMELGQPAPTLSGGEAQRVKLSSELCRRQTGKTVYILDEPTTGLHFADLEKLLAVLHRLVSLGNTVIVIEHNMDVIKTADWIIDLGPEGGAQGGQVVAVGTPQEIVKIKKSYTGQFLKKVLGS